MAMTYHAPLRERTRGRWHGILTALGLAPKYLTGKHGPCPMCGGKDRWRFIDTNGDGTWICNQCGADSGIGLVMKFLGLPFKDAAQRIEGILGDVQIQASRPEREEGKTRAKVKAMWRQASPVRRGDPVDLWLRRRGVGLDVYPSSIRAGERVRYYDGRSADVFSDHPAMLAMVSDPDGAPVTIHRTYLSSDGEKASVDSPRKLFSAVTKGSAIRLATPSRIVGVAEGIENALAAARLFQVPTWAAICAKMLENFEPPAGVEAVTIFGDNDRNYVGQRATHTLAARLSSRGLSVEVQIPSEPGDDWNDVLLARSNVA
jgi:putative DNA primase/helicase